MTVNCRTLQGGTELFTIEAVDEDHRRPDVDSRWREGAAAHWDLAEAGFRSLRSELRASRYFLHLDTSLCSRPCKEGDRVWCNEGVLAGI
jgi:hypothetical protein